ncbi:MAG TPA: hypothetical protein VHY37_08615 [Tepidisphaeraceae bacterium]|jgi:hypothetical protein|nr:hypothetical protein [Tepidisphaeraceae bacterium]
MERTTLLKQTKHIVVAGSLFIGTAMIAGCAGYGVRVVAYEPPPPPPPVVYVAPAPAVVVSSGPVFADPSVAVIDVEPDPALRVYVYDTGFPPGCYFYGGFYYYGGYRYPHDVFVHRYVEVNIREHRFADPRANRERSMGIEAQHRREYAAHAAKAAESQRRSEAQRGERRSTGDNPR